jgi:aminoglycoside phosphotransferase (APT) family kinase protein
VLKVSPLASVEWSEKVVRAASIVAKARARGWPTPAWLAVGTTSQGWPYQLQEWVEGDPMDRLGVEDVELILDLLETQAGIDPRTRQDWSRYDHEVVFADRDGLASRVRDSSPEGAEVVAAFASLCAPYRRVSLPGGDLVHGDLGTENILVRDGRIVAVIDTEAVGRGTRVGDLARILREGYMWRGDPPALERLLTAGLNIADPGVLLVCTAATVFSVSAFVLDSSVHGWPLAAAGALRLAEVLGEV